MNNIFNYTLEDLERYQPWDGYYRLRRKELEMVSNFFNIPKSSIILDLGCGLAFTSSMLSCYADSVIAIDLPGPDPVVNSRGMKKALEFINTVGAERVCLIGSSADKLPVKSGKVDLVFSQYVLEHIPLHLRKEVIKEMKRVLSPGGVIITIVPNFLDRIYNYPYYYFDLCIRLLRLLKQRIVRKVNTQRYEGAPFKNEPVHKKIRRLISLPLHGNYESHLQEITKQFPFVWENLFRESGLEIIKTFTIKHSPLATKLSIKFYEKTAWITKIIGGVPPFKYLGDCYCIVARKR